MIIWGHRTGYKPVGKGTHGCPKCGEPMTLFWSQRKFTLYFIPLFPVGSGRYLEGCKRCRAYYEADSMTVHQVLVTQGK